MRLNRGSIVRAAQDAVSCELDGEVAILNTRNGVHYGLTQVGASAWGMMTEPRGIAEIVQAKPVTACRTAMRLRVALFGNREQEVV